MADPFISQVASGALGDLAARATASLVSFFGERAKAAGEDFFRAWKDELQGQHSERTANSLRHFLDAASVRAEMEKVRDNRLAQVDFARLESDLRAIFASQGVELPKHANRQLRRWWRQLEEHVQPAAIEYHNQLRVEYLEAVYKETSRIEFTGLVDARGKPAARMAELFVLPRLQALGERPGIGPLPPARANLVLVNPDAPPPRAVLLGKPGAGKTTLLKCLAFSAAAHALASHNRAEVPPDLAWGGALAHQLPVFLRIRALVKMPAAAQGKMWDCLRHHAESILQKPVPEGFFEREADLGGLLLLFDGLDEGGPPPERNALARNLEAFARVLPEASTVIVSSRPHDYSHQFPELAHYDLCDLDDEEIAALIRKSGPFYESEASAAAERAGRLLAAVTDDAREYLQEMARNALLLTMIVRVHFVTGSLPGTRRDLYASCVNTLIEHWSAELGPSPISVTNKEKFLCQLAFQLQQDAGGELAERRDSLRVTKRELRRRLQEFLRVECPQKAANADEVITRLHERDAILVYDSGGDGAETDEAFRFVHRTFQEYFAGLHMATQLDAAEFNQLIAEDRPGWNETFYLAIASITHNPTRERILLDLVARNRVEFAYQAVNASRGIDAWLDALIRYLFRYYTRSGEGPAIAEVAKLCVGNQKARRVIDQLFERENRDARSLASAVELVEAFGGSPALTSFFAESRTFGLNTTEKMADCDGFWMDKYLVTNRDFESMIPGHHHLRDKYSDQDLQPVIDVNWWEASLFCRWRGPEFRLPSEEEWYKAASWDPVAKRNRKYPWGDEWEDARANTSERGFRRTTPVDAHPTGESEYGCFDMAGNVWEWTSSRVGPGMRVRGGSWSGTRDSAVSSLRSYNDPGYRNINLGCRCSRT